jgi:sugar phosphate isomerase/epimerase
MQPEFEGRRGMNTISRRGFLRAGAIGAGAGYLTPRTAELRASPLGLPIGCQTWPVRQTIGKDFDGTLRQLAGDGFQAIELCSPPGYERMGFGPLAAIPPATLREKIHAAGLNCQSCHFGFKELQDHLDERMAWAKELGLQQMIIASFGIPKDAQIADWTRAADTANKLGEKTRQAGIQLGYHNHDFEFQKIDGELIYDKLMDTFDPHNVKMQFQVSVIRLGYHAADFFEKYPGRFISIHLQDWSPTEKKEVTLGQGVVDWKKLFAAARTAGVKNYFVELDPPALKDSVPFLQAMS